MLGINWKAIMMLACPRQYASVLAIRDTTNENGHSMFQSQKKLFGGGVGWEAPTAAASAADN
jgi:hypothetical protein